MHPESPPYLSRHVFKFPARVLREQTWCGGSIKKGGVSQTLPRTSPFPGKESSRSPGALRPRPGWPWCSVLDVTLAEVMQVLQFSRAQEAEFSTPEQGAQALQAPAVCQAQPGPRQGLGDLGQLVGGFALHGFPGFSRCQVPPVMELPASAVVQSPAGSAARPSEAELGRPAVQDPSQRKLEQGRCS